jgi:HEAT repeat protein
MLGRPRTALRRAAFWELAADPGESATEALRLLAARADDELSAVAGRECRRRQFAAGGLSSPIASARSTPDDFAVFFQDFDRLSTAERQRKMLALQTDPSTSARQLRERMGSRDPLERARALRIVREAGLLAPLAEDVYKLATDRDRVVRAGIMSALGELPGVTSVRILRAALHDPDERVQANAVESLARLDVQEHAPVIRPKLDSPNSRVRANAVRALLRVEMREAGGALLEMLESPVDAQRVSALWVVERMRLRSVLERVLDMSRSDTDPRVRRRAQRVLGDLSMRQATAQAVGLAPRSRGAAG